MIKYSQTIRYKNLNKNLETLNNNILIELMLDANATDKLNTNKHLKKIKKLCGERIVCIHSASHSLDLGSKDDFIREYSLNKVLGGIKIAKKLGVCEFVFHTTCMPFMPEAGFNNWLKLSKPSFDRIINKCVKNNIIPLIENTYEKNSILFDILFDKYKELYMCFDIGHVNCFSKAGYDDYIEKFSNKIKVVHIHDNTGEEDSHLDLLKGNIKIENILIKFKNHKQIRFNLETNVDNFQYNEKILKEILN